jgi:hypothetical protein
MAMINTVSVSFVGKVEVEVEVEGEGSRPSHKPGVEKTVLASSEVKMALNSVSTKELAKSLFLDGPASSDGATPRSRSHCIVLIVV